MFILNCDKIKFMQTFDSMEKTLEYLDKINKENFDGEPFSIFGRRMVEDWKMGKDQGEIITEWVKCDYYIDSAVLCPKDNPDKYYTFYIRRINEKGEFIELD